MRKLELVTKYTSEIHLFLWIIWILALSLRLIGIGHGLPLFLNIDEPASLSGSLTFSHSLYIGRYDWPHLYYYLNAFALLVFSVVREISELFITLPDYYYQTSTYLLVIRVLNVILGSAIVFPVYFITKKFTINRIVPYISAIIVATLPVLVYETHFAKPDTIQTLVTAFILLLLSNMLLVKKIFYKKFILLGLLVGISTSIKYSGALMFLPALMVLIARLHEKKDVLSWTLVVNWLLSGLISVITFVIINPFTLIDYGKFFSYERGIGALWQFENIGKTTWALYPFDLYQTFGVMYRNNLGLFLWMIFLLLIVVYLFFNKRDKVYNFLLFPAIFFSFYISSFKRSPDHYFLFLIPFYVPVISIFINELCTNLLAKIRHFSKLSRILLITNNAANNYLLYLIYLVVLAPSILLSIKQVYLLSNTDTRVIALEWIINNLNKNDDKLIVVGAALDYVTFDIKYVKKAPKLDISKLDFNPPFYVIIGQDGLKKGQILEGDRDPIELEGNSEAILKYADVKLVVEPKNQMGPPIYIFYVPQIYIK